MDNGARIFLYILQLLYFSVILIQYAESRRYRFRVPSYRSYRSTYRRTRLGKDDDDNAVDVGINFPDQEQDSGIDPFALFLSIFIPTIVLITCIRCGCCSWFCHLCCLEESRPSDASHPVPEEEGRDDPPAYYELYVIPTQTGTDTNDTLTNTESEQDK